LKANKVNLFVSSVLFVFWYHSPNILDTPRINEEQNYPLCYSHRHNPSGNVFRWLYQGLRET
jgi:hypothetical protein